MSKRSVIRSLAVVGMTAATIPILPIQSAASDE